MYVSIAFVAYADCRFYVLQAQTAASGTEGGGIESVEWYIWLILAAAAAISLILIAVIFCFVVRFCARSVCVSYQTSWADTLVGRWCRRSRSSSPIKPKEQKFHRQHQLLLSENSAHSLVEDTDEFTHGNHQI